MNIQSAQFIKGVIHGDDVLDLQPLPQVAFIGRSNVGKSSTINNLTKVKGLAKTSSFPGRTRQINVFLINNKFYLIDLPGYGYAKVSKVERAKIEEVINSYLFHPAIQQKKVVLIIDAFVGPTDSDLEILDALLEYKKPVLILANKIDKVKKSTQLTALTKIKATLHGQTILPFSADEKKGGAGVWEEILK
ncbi:MAG: engB [Candidatus Nomurabacteria bacterium]|jgi:GTP-binding protein|nr:engB [Candidatus Nomurabacteria bacterium]